MWLELARRLRCKIKLWKSPTSKLFKSGYFLHPQPPACPSHAIGGRRSFPGSLIVSPLPLISLISRAFHPHNRQVNTKCITLPRRPSRLSVDKLNLNINHELRCILQFHSLYLDAIPTSLSEQLLSTLHPKSMKVCCASHTFRNCSYYFSLNWKTPLFYLRVTLNCK